MAIPIPSNRAAPIPPSIIIPVFEVRKLVSDGVLGVGVGVLVGVVVGAVAVTEMFKVAGGVTKYGGLGETLQVTPACVLVTATFTIS